MMLYESRNVLTSGSGFAATQLCTYREDRKTLLIGPSMVLGGNQFLAFGNSPNIDDPNNVHAIRINQAGGFILNLDATTSPYLIRGPWWVVDDGANTAIWSIQESFDSDSPFKPIWPNYKPTEKAEYERAFNALTKLQDIRLRLYDRLRQTKRFR